MSVTDIRLNVDFLQHAKTKVLRKNCGADGVIALINLWTYTAKTRPRGDLSGYSDEMIEAGANWEGEPGKFVGTLRDVRFLDDCALHDWKEHQDWVYKSPDRTETAKANGKCNNKSRLGKKANREQTESKHEAKPDQIDSKTRSPSPSPSPYPKTKDKEGASASLNYPKHPKIQAAIRGWVEFRKKAKKPVTQRALDLAVDKARRWCGKDVDKACELFDRAVERGWMGLFWPREWGPEPGAAQGASPVDDQDDSQYVGPGAEVYRELTA